MDTSIKKLGSDESQGRDQRHLATSAYSLLSLAPWGILLERVDEAEA